MPKLKDNPARWIPKDSEEIKNDFAVCYLYPIRRGDGWAVMAYGGGRKDADFHYAYRTETQAREKAASYLKNQEGHNAYKEERKAEQKAFKTSLQVGDVLYSSWGYDQTNIDWYQVVEVKPSGKSVVIRRIAGDTIENGFMSGYTTPCPDHFVGEEQLKRVQVGDTLTITSYASAWKWDGKPKYCSWYA